MNVLEKYFKENTGNSIQKWAHYFDIYDRYFSRYRGADVNVIEFGVAHGGSLQMWKHYFGPNAKIYGVDINPHCKKLEEDQIEIFIGNQADRQFLETIAGAVPRIDILIDDGGHKMDQQINTFEVLFPHIDKNGIYLCEDIHTSYRRKCGGGYKKKRGSFVEYSKNFIDFINAWHTQQPKKLSVSDFTMSVYALHYYSSVIVIEKRPMEMPYDIKTGVERVPYFDPSPRKSIFKRLFGKSNRLD
jgi:hypothetical protein